MARPREFNITEALSRAMHLFWLNGYHATTTRELDTRLGIGHQSLYNAFGDKSSLFRKVLLHYVESELGPMLTTIEHSGTSKKELVRFMAQTVDFLDTDPQRKGCLLFNIGVQRMREDPEVAKIITGYIGRLQDRFITALQTGLARGDIHAGVDAETTARGLVCTIMGLAVASRSGSDRETLVDMATMALRPLY